MKSNIKNHPAILLGDFIKDKRIDARLTLRDAAHWMEIEPSKLSELERGIGHHMTIELQEEIVHCFGLDSIDERTLEDRADEVSRLAPLNITDIFDEDDVLPLFIKLAPEKRKDFLETIGFNKS